MKNTIVPICVLIISSISILSQAIEDSFLNPLWDIYSNNYLNTPSAGRGFTGIASSNDISGILINPASVELKSKYQLNFQYTYKTRQKWQPYYLVEPFYLEHQCFSGSAGFGYRVNKNIQTGILYNNPNSMHMYLGRVFTLYGEVNDFYYNSIYHTIYVPFIYSNHRLHLGAAVSLTHTRTTSPPTESQGADDYLSTSWMFRGLAGFRYEFENGLSIGAKFQSGGKNKVKINYSGITNEPNIEGIFPWKAGAGIQYAFPKTGFKLLFDYNYAHNISKYYKDRHDIHIGLEAYIDKNWIVRGGFFTLNDFRDKSGGWTNPNDNYNQLFLTIGASFQLKNFETNVAILTSEISSGTIKNTFINGGLTFNF